MTPQRAYRGRRALSIVLGLLLWFAALAIAFCMSAGGDGWDDPFFCSLPLVFIYPLSLFRLLSLRPGSKNTGLLLLAAGVVLSLVLLHDIGGDDKEGFNRVWRFVPIYGAIWIALWLGWQLLVVISLFRKRAPLAE